MWQLKLMKQELKEKSLIGLNEITLNLIYFAMK